MSVAMAQTLSSSVTARLSILRTKIEAFDASARETILRRSRDHAAAVSKDVENVQTYRQLRSNAEVSAVRLRTVLLDEEAEHEVSTKELAAIGGKAKELNQKRESVKNEVETERNVVAAMVAEKDKNVAAKNHQTNRSAPELRFLEQSLSFKIRSDQPNKFIAEFENLDPKNPSKVHILILDVSGSTYVVDKISPPIPQIEDLVTTLNKSRKFYSFLKTVRNAWIDSYSPSAS